MTLLFREEPQAGSLPVTAVPATLVRGGTSKAGFSVMRTFPPTPRKRNGS